MEYGIPLVAVVFNDNRYANVYRQQKEWFDERFIAADLVNPDFVAHARSFGVRAERATTPNELQKLIREAIERREPRLIEVSLPADMPTPWRFIIEPPVRGDAAEQNL
jgi:acetolactate synthase-1/2/3 large subunit